MRKIIALFFLLGSLFAGYVEDLASYLLQKNFKIVGTFYIYDSQWLLGVDDGYGHISGFYRLMGSEPTDKNPFGWEPYRVSDTSRLKEMGYFVYIHFPQDEDKKYSWIYIDKATGAIYKLMGSKDGVFVYLDLDRDGIADPLPLYYRIKEFEVIFYDCKKSYSLKDGSLSVLTLSKSFGPIRYSCEGEWSSSRPLDLQNITIFEVLRGDVEREYFIGTIFKDLKRGIVSIEGVAQGRYISCDQNYAPLDLQSLKSAELLGKVIDQWGVGSKVAEGLVSDGCRLAPQSVQRFDLEIEKSITLQEKNETSTLLVYKQIQKR
ncbi:MAG: hypothetical protein C6H99_03210 [Epsilonproteobacteria bacterium]|nr:hypothetical protein [Campylobacterota bacterium]NPA63470.1 hypothetical protein [Campylobacterota bacterium]